MRPQPDPRMNTKMNKMKRWYRKLHVFSNNKAETERLAIERLPFEVTLEIFKYLSLEDLINCKSVCYYWNRIVHCTRRTSLVVSHLAANRLIWYNLNEPVDNETEVTHPALFFNEFNDGILANLRYLKVYIADIEHRLNLASYNVFVQLIHLEIDYALRNQNQALNLPNLKTLYLAGRTCCDLYIDCPKLQQLRFYGSNNLLHLSNPDSIIKLDIEFYGNSLTIFKNVQYIDCEQSEDMVVSTLSALGNLKEINFVNQTLLEKKTYRQFKRKVLDNLIVEMDVLGRTDLKIFIYGIELHADFDAHESDLEVHDLMIAKYEHLADTLPYISKVDYTHLIESLDFGIIPRDYFTRFVNIQSVSATKVLNQQQFIWFLAKLKNLKSLDLVNPSLSQRFYDQLPATCSLNHFLLDEYHDIQINFAFIGEFKLLRTLRVNQDLSHRSFISLVKSFDKLHYLSTLDLKINEAFVKLKKNVEDLKVTYSLELREDLIESEELGNYFKWLKIDSRI